MSDTAWRRWERAWEANPGDQRALRRAIAERRRAGQRVPGWMLEEQIFPERRFDVPVQLRVHAQLPGGELLEVGRTPAGGEGLTIPAHRTWWVQPEARLPFGVSAFEDLAAVCHVVTAQDVPGLVAKRAQITDPDVERIASCHPLRHLELGLCTMLTEHGLRPLGRMQLTHLGLLDCGQVEEEGLAALADLELARLTLTGAERLTDAGLAHLGRLHGLLSLRLSDAKLTDDGLRHLAGLDTLRSCRLENCPQLTGRGLAYLSPSLRTLSLSWCKPVNDDGLTPWRACPTWRASTSRLASG